MSDHTSHRDASPAPERGRRGPRRRVKVLAALVATLLALGVCELALRVFWHNSYRESPDHMLQLKIHQAGRDYVVDRAFLDPASPNVRLRADERSYILPSFQHEDPHATVAFLGGSTTECSIVQEPLRFPALVSTLLGGRGIRVNTLNAALAGNTVHDSINVLLNHVLDDDPDFVVLMHATNDFGLLARFGDYRIRSGAPLDVSDVGKWLKQTLTRHVYLAALVRRLVAGRKIRHIGEDEIEWRNSFEGELPVHHYRRRLHAFVHLCRDFDVRPVLMTQPLASIRTPLTPAWANLGAQDRFNEIVREVARAEDVPLIDLAEALPRRPEWQTPEEILYDGMHVTDAGSRVYAEIISEALLELILEFRLEEGG